MKTMTKLLLCLLLALCAGPASALEPTASAEESQKLDAREEALMARLDAGELAALLRGESQSLSRDPSEGLLFFPVEPCRLVESLEIADPLQVQSTRLYSAGGCGVQPERGKLLGFSTAMSALVRIELKDARGAGSIALWRAGAARPASGLLDFAPGQSSMSTAIVPVCAEVGIAPCAIGDIAYAVEGAPVAVTIDLLGYFAPPAPAAPPAAALADPAEGAKDAPVAVAARSLTSPFWESGASAGHIFYADGKVGIGTNETPAAQLEVWGAAAPYPNAKAARFVVRGESSSFRDQIAITSESSAASATGYGIAFTGTGNHRGGLYARDVSGSAQGEMTLWARSGGNIILSGGNTGIGVTSPTAKLHVGGEVKLNLGEGLLIGQDPGYWSGSYDARLLQILDSNGSSGNADGGLVVESSTNDGNRRPILTMRHHSGYPKVGIGTGFPAGTLEAHSRRQTGTGTLTSIGAAVTGTGTVFTSQLVVGSELAVGNEVRRVAAITSDSALTLNVGYDTDLVDAGFTYQQPALLLSGDGNLGLGTGAQGLTERLEVAGNIKLTGNLLAGGDLCIGTCP